MPSGLSWPGLPGLGICTRRNGRGRYSPAPQLRGEPVEELIDPEALHVIDRYAIDTRCAPVSTDLPPRPAHHVAAGDLVKQGMKTAIPILLSAAVQHALESTNPIHTHRRG